MLKFINGKREGVPGWYAWIKFMNELVSILLLCYNHEKFVEDCLKSIYGQTYDNIELIILDNGSKDASVKVIESYIAENEGKLKRVEFIKNAENAGISKGVNQMIYVSKGEYIKVFSADDILDLDGIRNLASCLKDNPSYSVVVGNGYVVSENYSFGEESLIYDGGALYAKEPDLSGNYMLRLLERDNIAAPAVMLKRDVFKNIGYFDEKMAYEDWEYWLRLVKAGGKIGYCNNHVVFYRRSPQAVTYMQRGQRETEEKLMNYYRHNMEILKMYGDCVTKEELDGIYIRIYEKYIQKGLDLACPRVVREIFTEMKQRNIPITWKNRLKYLLLICGLRYK